MDLQYPVGKFKWEGVITDEQRQQLIDQIEQAPAQLRKALAGLTEEQVDTPYRPGGWTVRPVVHHLSDSHMNAYVRFRLALTEDEPTIKPYDRNAGQPLRMRAQRLRSFPFPCWNLCTGALYSSCGPCAQRILRAPSCTLKWEW